MSRSKLRPSVLVAGIALIAVGFLFVRCTRLEHAAPPGKRRCV